MKAVRILILIIFVLTPFALSAQSVDILWQGEGYVPPFYKGKTLWAKQTPITFVAIPQGLGDPNQLNYQWIRNGTVLGLVSGIGKNSLSFADTVLSKPQEIKVEIVSPNDDVLAESSLTLVPTNPVLAVYEESPLYGYVFEREVGQSFRLRKQEITFAAFPFFAGASTRNDSNLIYRWNASDEGQSGPSATYRVPEGESGTSIVNLSFSDSVRILPDLRRSFTVKFGQDD